MTTTIPFRLISPDFVEGDTLDDNTLFDGLDCHGRNRSPALNWLGMPAGTKSLVLVLVDRSAREGDGFIHWVVFNIPAGAFGLPENAGAMSNNLAGGARHGYSDFLERRYGGPCPPHGSKHRYEFTLYALNIAQVEDSGTPMTWHKLRVMIRPHILGQTVLTGFKGR